MWRYCVPHILANKLLFWRLHGRHNKEIATIMSKSSKLRFRWKTLRTSETAEKFPPYRRLARNTLLSRTRNGKNCQRMTVICQRIAVRNFQKYSTMCIFGELCIYWETLKNKIRSVCCDAHCPDEASFVFPWSFYMTRSWTIPRLSSNKEVLSLNTWMIIMRDSVANSGIWQHFRGVVFFLSERNEPTLSIFSI